MVGLIIFDALKKELDSLRGVAETKRKMSGLSQRNADVHLGYLAGLRDATKAVKNILVFEPEDFSGN